MAHQLSFEGLYVYFIDSEEVDKKRADKIKKLDSEILNLMNRYDQMVYEEDTYYTEYEKVVDLENKIEEMQRLSLLLEFGYDEAIFSTFSEEEQWAVIGRENAKTVFRRKKGSGASRKVSIDSHRAEAIIRGDYWAEFIKGILEEWMSKPETPLPVIPKNDAIIRHSDSIDLYFDSAAEALRVYKITSETITVKNKINQIRSLLADPKRPMHKYLLEMNSRCDFRKGSIDSVISSVSRGRK